MSDLKHDVWTWITCGVGYFFLFFGLNYSSALLVIISVEKFIALYFPLKTITLCTVHRAKRVSLVTAVLFTLYCAQFGVFSAELVDKHGKFCWHGKVSWQYLSILLGIIDASLNVYVPFIIILVTNSTIIYKFTKVRFSSRQGSTESTSQALSKSTTTGTVMLLTISFVFIILKAPIVVANRIWTNGTIPQGIFKVLIGIEYVNHGINGVLYCVSGSRFRTELRNLFHCKKENTNQPNTTMSSVDLSKSCANDN